MAYDAFISYSYSADGRLAPAIQTGLQRLARPSYRRQALRVFRDETGLSANPHLWGSIEQALDDSRTATRPQHWLATKSPETLLIVLTDGELAWDAAAADFDRAASNALPLALFAAFAEEPRHLDLRWARDETQLDLRHSQFRSQIAALAAPMHGIPKDELESEDVRLHRRALRLAWGGALALLVLTVAVLAGAVAAVSYANRAHASEQRAKKLAADLTSTGSSRRSSSRYVTPVRSSRRRTQRWKVPTPSSRTRARSNLTQGEWNEFVGTGTALSCAAVPGP